MLLLLVCFPFLWVCRKLLLYITLSRLLIIWILILIYHRMKNQPFCFVLLINEKYKLHHQNCWSILQEKKNSSDKTPSFLSICGASVMTWIYVCFALSQSTQLYFWTHIFSKKHTNHTPVRNEEKKAYLSFFFLLIWFFFQISLYLLKVSKSSSNSLQPSFFWSHGLNQNFGKKK